MGASEHDPAGSTTPVTGSLRAAEGDWRSVLPDVLTAAGEATGVDRCYVFQNRRGPDGRLWMDLCGEWDASGIRQLFDDPRNHLHPYYPDFQRWIDLMGGGEEIVETIHDLREPEHRVLRAEGTVATWQVPVTVTGEWWGFVGLDLCTERPWTARDEAVVRELVDALSASVAVQRAAEDERLRDDLFRSIVEEGPAVTYIDAIDDSASSIYVSPQIETLLGYAPQEWCNDPGLWPRALHPDDRARALAENARHNETGEPFRLEYRMFAKDGRVVWVHDAARVVCDDRGMPRYSHGVMIDISERKRTEEEVAFQAYHDELTGLPSRAMFEELLDLSVSRARRHDGSVAVLCVDLNDFSLVNDSLGHQAGDALLIAVADRLREAARETDLVARRGGDQFLLLLADLARDDGGIDGAVMRAESVAQRIQESLLAPFGVDGTEVYVAASVGISMFPDDAADAGTLQRNAESAMYEAKKGGRSGFVLSVGGALDSSAKLQFVTRLRKAVETQRWVLHYQPVVDLESGQDDRRRGADPMDGGRRNARAARRVHPARRGAGAHRADRPLGGPGADVSGAGVAGARHRSGGRVQPVPAAVLAARPRAPHPAGVPRERRGPVAGARRGHRDLGDARSRPGAGDPPRAARRRLLDRDRRLRDRVLVACPASARCRSGC